MENRIQNKIRILRVYSYTVWTHKYICGIPTIHFQYTRKVSRYFCNSISRRYSSLFEDYREIYTIQQENISETEGSQNHSQIEEIRILYSGDGFSGIYN